MDVKLGTLKGFAIAAGALWVGLMLIPLVRGFGGGKGRLA